MKVRIISYENINSWILGKFARKMQEELTKLNVSVEIGAEPDPSADINHHIIYIGYDHSRPLSNDTLMITHIDDLYKFNLLKEQMQHARLGICMSRDTMMQLVTAGIPPEKLCFVSPAHDLNIPPKRWIIGITTRLYPDGCKREDLLVKVCQTISPELFEFRIMGSGWEDVIEKITARGVKVVYYPDFDPDRYIELMRSIDYYLYLGMDEGSMGFLDALSAGVKTIVTAQGFHLDVKDGITHAFTEADELSLIFMNIAGERKQLIDSVSQWTWSQYALKHYELWQYLVGDTQATNSTGRPGDDGLNSLLHKEIDWKRSTNDLSKSRLLVSSWRKKFNKIRNLSELKKTIRRKLKGN